MQVEDEGKEDDVVWRCRWQNVAGRTRSTLVILNYCYSHDETPCSGVCTLRYALCQVRQSKKFRLQAVINLSQEKY